jgi:hypothetical protein
MNFAHLRAQLAALRQSMPAQSALPANFIDPISAMLRARIAIGDVPGPTSTPAEREASRSRLRERLAEAGRRARARVWT